MILPVLVEHQLRWPVVLRPISGQGVCRYFLHFFQTCGYTFLIPFHFLSILCFISLLNSSYSPLLRNFRLAMTSFSKDFIDQKARRKRCTKVWVRYFGVLHHQPGRYERRSCRWYTILLYFSFHICLVDGVAHRNIGLRLFVHRFRLAFWSIKSFETSECESRIVGRSPCYDDFIDGQKKSVAWK